MLRTVVAACTLWTIWTTAFAAATPPPPLRTAGAFPQSAYVWQRQWTTDTCTAVRTTPAPIANLIVLAEEIETGDRQVHTFRVEMNTAALQAAGRPVELTVRLGPWFGSMATAGELFPTVRAAAVDSLERARADGLTATGVQLDFDCPSSQLAAYAEWLRALRAALPGTRLTCTALASWTTRPEFSLVAGAVDGFVLQVHSLPRPERIEAARTLCDLGQARAAVDRAARFGTPFQVALPTYGYLLDFDVHGRYIGLAAETAPKRLPIGGRRVALEADPREMLELMAGWQQDRPALMTGVIWFRLPTAADRRGWPQVTFAAVTAGKAPTPRIEARLEASGDGLFDLVLMNVGDAAVIAPEECTVVWPAGVGPAIAADGCGGWQVRDEMFGAPVTAGQRVCRWVPPAAKDSAEPFRLDPGATRTIGWLRFSSGVVGVEVHLP